MESKREDLSFLFEIFKEIACSNMGAMMGVLLLVIDSSPGRATMQRRSLTQNNVVMDFKEIITEFFTAAQVLDNSWAWTQYHFGWTCSKNYFGFYYSGGKLFLRHGGSLCDSMHLLKNSRAIQGKPKSNTAICISYPSHISLRRQWLRLLSLFSPATIDALGQQGTSFSASYRAFHEYIRAAQSARKRNEILLFSSENTWHTCTSGRCWIEGCSSWLSDRISGVTSRSSHPYASDREAVSTKTVF